MYRISPFTPIFFTPSSDFHGPSSVTRQVFADTDNILLEVIATGDNQSLPDLLIRNLDTLDEYTYSWRTWVMNAETILYFIELHGMDNGLYEAVIGDRVSEPFIVTSDDDLLRDTVLLQYSNKDNRQRNDVVFWIDSMQRFFDFRVPGGFKDDNWSFVVSNEQFVTSDNDKIDLFAQEGTVKTLTVGNSDGCPVWFAELVNRLLCCNYVYVDGVRYTRNESEVPEMTAEVEGLKSYIFKLGLQRVVNLDPYIEESNLLVARRVENDIYRIVPTNEIRII